MSNKCSCNKIECKKLKFDKILFTSTNKNMSLKVWNLLQVNIFANEKVVITDVECCNVLNCMHIEQLLCNVNV